MSLYTKYRPSGLSGFVGNGLVVESFEALFSKPRQDIPHALLFTGPSGCLHGDTKIYDPIDSTNLTVRERHKKRKPFHVISFFDGRLVIAEAMPPVQYSEARMFRVDTPESVFYVTGEHRFLLYTGEYLSLMELIEHGYDEVRLRSTSDTFRKAQHQDARHYCETTVNSQVDCRFRLHSCGERPLFSQEACLAPVPSHTGAQVHISQIIEDKHTHREKFGPLSKMDFLDQTSFFSRQSKFSSYQEICGFENDQLCTSVLIEAESGLSCITRQCPHRLSSLSYEDRMDTYSDRGNKFLSACDPPIVEETATGWTIINKIEEVGKQKYYDFHVPIYNNYWSGGIFHHNCGKTTLARIAAAQLGCSDMDLVEVDSADFRGIDTVRDIRRQMGLSPLAGSCRVWILDEIHRATVDAMSALLKALEDTPPHVYFMLATTDPQKLLPTILSRCTELKVAPLEEEQIVRLLHRVTKQEGKSVPMPVLKQIAMNSLGHPRAALVMLDKIIDLPEASMNRAVEKAAVEQSQIIDLCRMLMKKANWKQVSGVLKGLKDQAPEDVRRAVLGYCSAVLLSGDEPKAFVVMDAFRAPTYDLGWPGIVMACYEIVGEEV